MPDILIRGMEMPKEWGKILIATDGSVWVNAWPTRGYMRMENVYAIPLPEGHGDLIDRDALKKRTPMVIDYSAGGFGTDGSIRPVRGYGDWQIDQAPTIVPAEGGTEECSEN